MHVLYLPFYAQVRLETSATLVPAASLWSACRECCEVPARCCWILMKLLDLPDDLAFNIFSRLPFADKQRTLPLVCKQIQAILLCSSRPSLWVRELAGGFQFTNGQGPWQCHTLAQPKPWPPVCTR